MHFISSDGAPAAVRWRNQLLRFALALAVTAVLAPGAVRAQAGRDSSQANACLAAIPAEAMRRVTAYLVADAADSATGALLANEAVLTQAVAAQARALLGAPPEQVPRGEPTVTWQGIGSGLAITAYRDGRLFFHIASDSDRTASSVLLQRALSAVRASGDAWFVWPDSALDSLVFRLRLRVPLVDRAGDVRLMPMQSGFPVLSIATPWEEPAHIIRQPHVQYPPQVQSERVEGFIILQFVVDMTGRADITTVRDVWPADRPRLTGEMGEYYRALLEAVRSALPNARFEPARIGGCPMPQLVQMPFNFKLAR